MAKVDELVRPAPMVTALAAGRRELDVAIREDQEDEGSAILGVIHVVYNPKRMTSGVERAFMEMGRAKGNGAASVAATLIRTMVVEWDVENNYPVIDALGNPVLDEDGNPTMEARTVPLTEEALDDLSIQITVPVMMAIVRDMDPKARGRNGKGTPQTIPARSPSTSD